MDSNQNVMMNHPFQSSNASTSSFGYPNGYPSGTKSESASPGPMQRFRHMYHNEMQPMQKVPFQQNGQQYSQPYATQWLNTHCRSGYGSAPGSRPGSVMSTMSSATVASNYTAISDLSVITNTTELNMCYADSYSQMPQTMSENANPAVPPNMNGTITDLCTSLRESADLKGCIPVLMTINSYANSHTLDYVTNPLILRHLCDLLLYRLQMAREWQDDEVIKLTLKTINSMLHSDGSTSKAAPARNSLIKFMRKAGQPGADLLVSFLVPNKDYTKLVLIIISSFFVIELWKHYLQKIPDIVGIFLRVIKHELQVVRSIALASLTKIVAASHGLKVELCRQNGMQLLLDLLQTDADERLFYRISRLMNTLLTNSGNQNLDIFKHFIHIGGVTTCAKHLGHGSPRLLRELVGCIQYVSDLTETTTTASWNWDNLVQMLKVIGSADYKLDSDVIGCLANMAAKNHYVKQYLVTNNAPVILMRMLYNLEDPKFFDLWPQQIYDELMDHTLWALQMLINNYALPVQNYAPQACKAITNFKGWNGRLCKVLAEGLTGAVNRALMILNMIMMHCPEAIPTIESTTYNQQPMSYYIYGRLNQVMELFVAPNATIWNSCRLYRGPYSPTTIERPEFTNEVKLMISRALKSICLLVGYDDNGHVYTQSTVELDRIIGFIKDAKVTPFHWLAGLLQRQSYDQLKLLLKLGTFFLTRKYEMTQLLNDEQVYNGLSHCCSNSTVYEEATNFYRTALNIARTPAQQ